MRVTDEERALLQEVLNFANLETIESTAQVEGPFMALPIVWSRFKTLPEDEAEHYIPNRDDLRRWLDTIAAGQGATIGREIAALMGTITRTDQFDPEQREFQTVYALDGVQAAIGYALALLLSRNRDLAGRVARCPACKRFTADLDVHDGRPRSYCPAPRECRLTANTARSRESMRQSRKNARARGEALSSTQAKEARRVLRTLGHASLRATVPDNVPAGTRIQPKTSQRQPTRKKKTPQ